MNQNESIFQGSGIEFVPMLASFLYNLYQDMCFYSYVSITERRFFNLFYQVFLTQPDYDTNNSSYKKLVSNNGLLLQHKALSDYYLKKGEFPSILIADDLAIHGRSIGKFLIRLEQSIIDDFEEQEGQLTKKEKEMLHYHLVSAIDIRVFARSRTPILLEDGYATKLKFDQNLYNDQLHWVTDFLSKKVNSVKVANTSFVFSARCEGAGDEDVLTKIRHPRMKSNLEDWMYVFWLNRWNADSDNLHAYIRLFTNENGEVYLISTVRFYECKVPLLISYPIFFEMEVEPSCGDGLDGIYKDLYDVLSHRDSCYSPLYHILDDHNSCVQEAKGQLISSFLSIADLLDFCRVYDLPADQVLQNTDVLKISINYGEKTCPAFSALLNDPELCLELANIIRAGLHRQAVPLLSDQQTKDTFPIYSPMLSGQREKYILSLFGNEDRNDSVSVFSSLYQTANQLYNLCKPLKPNSFESQKLHNIVDHMDVLSSAQSKSQQRFFSKTALSDDFSGIPVEKLDIGKVIDFINMKLEQEIYNQGIGAEAHAHHYSEAPFLYPLDHFGDYKPSKQKDARKSDNPSGVSSFKDFMQLGGKDIPVSVYGRVVAYLMLVDSGLIAGKIQNIQNSGTIYSIYKAGERAMFYLPKRLSLFIPALATVERGALLLNLSPQEAVLRFVQNHLQYEGNCRVVIARLFDLKTFIHEYLDIFSKSGQMFSGWNFEPLVTQNDDSLQAAQKDFLNQAETFLQK